VFTGIVEDNLNELNQEIEELVLSEEPLTKAEVRKFVPAGIRDSKALVRKLPKPHECRAKKAMVRLRARMAELFPPSRSHPPDFPARTLDQETYTEVASGSAPGVYGHRCPFSPPGGGAQNNLSFKNENRSFPPRNE
jgi:hypothetical protein